MLDSLLERFASIVVLDVETTGIDPVRDEIIELAALQIEKSKDIVDEFDLLVALSPNRRLPPVITQLTGISEDALRDEGVPKAVACKRFADMLSNPNTLAIAYNAQFDLCFLYYLLDGFGRDDVLRNAKFLDALTVYKDRQPYPHKLSDAIYVYGLQAQNTHRAIDDTKATVELMCAMEGEQKDLFRYVNLFGYNPKYGISGQKIPSVKYVQQPYNAVKKLYE